MSGDSAAAARASAFPPDVTPFPAAIGAALSISATARHTGITVATLRMWQTRYGLGPSLTTPGGPCIRSPRLQEEDREFLWNPPVNPRRNLDSVTA